MKATSLFGHTEHIYYIPLLLTRKTSFYNKNMFYLGEANHNLKSSFVYTVLYYHRSKLLMTGYIFFSHYLKYFET